jgi:hypothetical protein
MLRLSYDDNCDIEYTDLNCLAVWILQVRNVSPNTPGEAAVVKHS